MGGYRELPRPLEASRGHVGEKLSLGVIFLKIVRIIGIMLLGKVNPSTWALGSFS